LWIGFSFPEHLGSTLQVKEEDATLYHLEERMASADEGIVEPEI
jgi:hypothetical protein